MNINNVSQIISIMLDVSTALMRQIHWCVHVYLVLFFFFYSCLEVETKSALFSKFGKILFDTSQVYIAFYS